MRDMYTVVPIPSDMVRRLVRFFSFFSPFRRGGSSLQGPELACVDWRNPGKLAVIIVRHESLPQRW